MKLTATERRGLREYARTRSWTSVHGRTIHALERKGLIGFIRGRRGITPAGHAELAVPNIFDNLFEKESAMPKKKLSTRGLSAKQEAALKRLRTVTNLEIEEHPLLDREQKKLCKTFRTRALKDGDEFTLLDFAKIVLRATGCDYARSSTSGEYANPISIEWARTLNRAALLYTYEALKRGPAIVTETIEERGTLRDIELLMSHGS